MIDAPNTGAFVPVPPLPPEPDLPPAVEQATLIRRSATIGKLFLALSQAQGEMRAAVKDATNPHFKNRFASLESIIDAIREPLAKNKIGWSQHATTQGKRVFVTTLIGHESDEWMESTLSMLATQDAPQAAASAVTYARRYALAPIVGIASADDDGEGASTNLPGGIRQDAGKNSELQKAAAQPAGGVTAPASVGASSTPVAPAVVAPPKAPPQRVAASPVPPPPPGMKPPMKAPGS